MKTNKNYQCFKTRQSDFLEINHNFFYLSHGRDKMYMNALIHIFITFKILPPAFCEIILCNIFIISLLYQTTTLK